MIPALCAAISASPTSVARPSAFVQWQRPLVQPLPEALPLQVLLHHEVDVAFGADVVDNGDVRVVEGGGSAGFLLEPG